MENLKKFSFDKLKDITDEKKYNLVYINYDRANGIKVLSKYNRINKRGEK